MERNNEVTIPRLLTTREVTERTRLAYWRLLQLVEQGKAPPHMRIGNTLRFPEDGVAAWITENTNQKESEQ